MSYKLRTKKYYKMNAFTSFDDNIHFSVKIELKHQIFKATMLVECRQWNYIVRLMNEGRSVFSHREGRMNERIKWQLFTPVV